MKQYRNLNRIYENSGTVAYRAMREVDGTSVVLKMPKTEYPSASVIVKYGHEYDVLRAFQTHGVIKAYELIKHQNRPVLVLEDFDAESLADWLKEAPFDLRERLTLAVQICACIEEIHDGDVIHRDINPSNILIHAETLEVKLTDFSLATQSIRERQEAVRATQLEGTLAYLSPEQTGRMNRPVDYRTDIYSFGATLYEMLTGEPPFQADDALEMVHAHIARKPLALTDKDPAIPQVVSDIVLKCLAKSAEDRYQSARGLQKDLERCLDMWPEWGRFNAFPLGQHDRARHFQISQKVYGREAQWETIERAFRRANHGATEVVLLTGPEGSGKTAMMSDAIDSGRDAGSFLGRGTCSPFHHGVPYAALSEALGQAVSSLLELPDEKIAAWRDKIHAALGPDVAVLIGMIPGLERLTGTSMDVPAINSGVGRDVLRVTLNRFLSLLGGERCPLVLCLDDLHFADEDTLVMLKYLLCDDPVPYLLVLGTVLEQVWPADHPVPALLAALRSGVVSVSELDLPYLGTVEVGALLVDSFQFAEKDAADLAEILVAKTHGNPFFVHQLLTDLYQSGRLTFDGTRDRWVWDRNEIALMDSTTNVVDFMVRRIDSMSPTAQALLMQAACIGDGFDLNVLAMLRNEDVQEILPILGECVRQGFVERVRVGTTSPTISTASLSEAGVIFRFAHARIRQAVYDRLSLAARKDTHLRIALWLSDGLTDEEKKRFGYELADHFLAADNLVVDVDQRIAAARACQIAGDKSAATAAFPAALEYAQAGVNFLPEDAWNARYDLSFALYLLLLKCQVACGQYEQAIELSQSVRPHTATIVDLMEITGVQMNAYSVLERNSERYQLGTETLRLCGIEVPRNISRKTAQRQYQVVKELIGTRSREELMRLPKMSDPILIGALRLLLVTGSGLDQTKDTFFLLKVVELSLRHGIAPDSSVGFLGVYLLTNVGRKKELDRAYELGYFGYQVADLFEDTRAKSNALGYFMTSLNHWRNPLRTSLVGYGRYDALMTVSGGVGISIVNSYVSSYAQLACGDVLPEVTQRAQARLSQAEAYRLQMPADLLAPLLEVLGALQDSSATPTKLEGVTVTENPGFGFADRVLAQSYLNCMLFYLFDQPKEVVAVARDGFRFLDTRTENIDLIVPEHTFYHGLIFASVYGEAKASEQAEYKRRLQRISRLMRVWAAGCPDNYQHKSLLLQAEYARLFGKPHQAADLYDEAIASAKEYGFLQNEAIANECAAKFYLNRNKEKLARAYFAEARYLYEQWGALGKVKQLEEKYPHLFDTMMIARSANGSSSRGSTSTRSREQGSHVLDLSTILKTSQVISREVQLDRLLSLMLKLVIENVGAENGYWILQQDEGWAITASADVNGQEVFKRAIPIGQSNHVSFGIAQYVIRTQEVVVLQNACREGRFVRDPHIRNTQTKSVLCFPVVKKGTVIAVLYVENNLVTHAFTPERVEMLKLLSGQAAISIENARLYESLDHLVQERTEALRRTQQQMIESEKMASLGQLTAGVAHEINNPINFVVSSATPLRRDIEDIISVLNLYRSTVDEQNLHRQFERVKKLEEELDVDYAVQEVQQLLKGIEEGGKRTAEIVKGLRTFSRLDEDEIKTASVTEGIESTLTLLRKKAEPRIQIVREYGEIPVIECYPGKLNQVYMNLLSNAIQAIPGEGEIRISVQHIGDSVRIQIADTGQGMTEEVQRRIFEPFFTTKDVGVGTGLGLSISYGIIERHNGSIEVHSESGKGTTFTLTLPVRQTAS